ncbi:hypothetical protein [Pengzhenrongella phosphoraccumulans]|uniref:hypothetical protein n=1 Tax=Pengzhenrongella phosphoraccumulans TaxID=3114394 RepID=UPI00388E2C00
MKSTLDTVTDLVAQFRIPHTEHGGPVEIPSLPEVGSAVDVVCATDVERTDVLGTFVARRSKLNFAPHALPRDDVLDDVIQGLLFDCSLRGALATQVPLEAFVFLKREGSDASAVYSVRAGGARSLQMTLTPQEMEDLGVQREFGRASAIITIAGDLDQAEMAQGGSGYPMLIVRAASAAYEMCLSAVSRGWICTVYAGLIPASVRGRLGSDGSSRHQLFALAIGTERR